MSKIIGLLGFINSGKGTVASYLVDRYNFRQDSFASSLKDACSLIFDWPRNLLEGDTTESRQWREKIDPWWAEKLNIKNFSPRLALQLVGTEALRNGFHSDIWFLTLQNRIRKNPDQHVVISDVRFPNEIKFIQDNKGILIRVNRGNLPVWYDDALAANKGDTEAQERMKTYPQAHQSEWAWVGTNIDYELENNSTVDNLKINLDTLIEKIL